MIFVVPSKRFSRRVPNKNRRRFAGGKSLTDLAVEFALSVAITTDTIHVIADDYSYPHKQVRIFDYPKCGSMELNNSLEIWKYALSGACGTEIWKYALSGACGPVSATALIEPSCYRPSEVRDLYIASVHRIYSMRTINTVQLAHRYGMKAHVFVQSGAFYIALTDRVLDETVFDERLEYVIDEHSINIDTEDDFMRAVSFAEASAFCI